ncbi:hypothetical protein PUNSTDRAFT_139361 [Punctularia strigosozonata HHB-11173 SS5]|uniref:Uncharacterized protein n=1 Tax=Punctularia strigosozonata (strain HHB-11173) TaxID=741275 RepID=R7RZV2_PUNST|nr:uncharacterized protein PUNSTDRAFT_139361 [Punctularia strigosozonata HHB-11173 SS5]EIN03645.1 hypothetical protein PUNSTDRAFT_139361 [Punctularia strigosozonata HHB-11173 SS5]
MAPSPVSSPACPRRRRALSLTLYPPPPSHAAAPTRLKKETAEKRTLKTRYGYAMHAYVSNDYGYLTAVQAKLAAARFGCSPLHDDDDGDHDADADTDGSGNMCQRRSSSVLNYPSSSSRPTIPNLGLGTNVRYGTVSYLTLNQHLPSTGPTTPSVEGGYTDRYADPFATPAGTPADDQALMATPPPPPGAMPPALVGLALDGSENDGRQGHLYTIAARIFICLSHTSGVTNMTW